MFFAVCGGPFASRQGPLGTRWGFQVALEPPLGVRVWVALRAVSGKILVYFWVLLFYRVRNRVCDDFDMSFFLFLRFSELREKRCTPRKCCEYFFAKKGFSNRQSPRWLVGLRAEFSFEHLRMLVFLPFPVEVHED